MKLFAVCVLMVAILVIEMTVNVKSSCSRKYQVDVQTSARRFWATGGTNDTVYLTVTGTSVTLTTKMLDRVYDLRTGAIDSYEFEGPDVGEIKYLLLQKTGNDDWHLDKIVVSDAFTGVVTTFPHYDYVHNCSVKVRPGKAVLPFQETCAELADLRRDEMQRRREEFNFMSNNPGLPGAIAEYNNHSALPRLVQFHDAKFNDFWGNAMESRQKFELSTFYELSDVWDRPENTVEIAERFASGEDLEMLHILRDSWDTDEEFGRQMLNGAHPVMIEICRELPPHFLLTEEMVQPYLLRGLTFEEEMGNGHVYIIDHEVLEGVPHYSKGDDTRYSAAPTVILYVRPSGQLVPIAIKLDHELISPIWIPSDGLGWTLAKIYFKNADIQVHQMGSHLLKSHLVLEGIFIAMLRNLHTVHPVYKLLMPHMRHTIAINTLARDTLVSDGGIIETTMSISGSGAQYVLIRKIFSTFRWENLNIPKDIEQRGVGDQHMLPNYHYRDDALLLWKAVDDFIRELMADYYDDTAVTNDKELQSFIAEVHDVGLPVGDDGADKGVPASISSFDGLCSFLTTIVYTASCGHASVNFGQFQYFAFSANYPTALRQPPPTTKDNVTLDDIMAALPDQVLTGSAVSISYTLSMFSENEVYLGHYPEEYFTENNAKLAQANFRNRLDEISSQIFERNENLAIKYRYLMPGRIPSSVAI